MEVSDGEKVVKTGGSEVSAKVSPMQIFHSLSREGSPVACPVTLGEANGPFSRLF